MYDDFHAHLFETNLKTQTSFVWILLMITDTAMPFFIPGHQEINYKYDSNTFETKIEAEPRLWKVGKQVFGSAQRECS